MKYLHPVAAVPNSLIQDTTIHYTTKKVGTVLLFLSGRKNRAVKVTVADLARLAHCSTATVQQAISELIQGGYLIKRRSYRYSAEQQRLVYGANSYVWMKRQGGYTLLKKEILDYDLTPAAFTDLLFLYLCGSREGRAFPSLRHIAGQLLQAGKAGLDMAKSTVCLAVKALHKVHSIIRLRCRTAANSYAANSYLLTDLVISGRRGASNVKGSPKFDKHRDITKITGAFTEREIKYGVAQFGNLHNLDRAVDVISEFWFDGTGVRVSATGEHDLTA